MGSYSYQEKSLYGELVAELAVFVPYFVLIHLRHPTVNVIASAIVVLIVASIVLQSAIAAMTRNRLKDERDRVIRLLGYRAGYLTVVSLMVVSMGGLWAYSAMGLIDPRRVALHFISGFFAALLLAEVVKTATQLVAYRRAS